MVCKGEPPECQAILYKIHDNRADVQHKVKCKLNALIICDSTWQKGPLSPRYV